MSTEGSRIDWATDFNSSGLIIESSLVSLRTVRSAAVNKIATITPTIHTEIKYNDSEYEIVSMAAESTSQDYN